MTRSETEGILQINSFNLSSIVISPEHVTSVLLGKVADGAATFEFYGPTPRRIIAPQIGLPPPPPLRRLKCLKLNFLIRLFIFRYLL
jgi:hypothetical protein